MSHTPSAPARPPCCHAANPVARRGAGRGPTAAALLLALACADASAVIRLSVQADFPASGFADGPVWGTSSPQRVNVWFDLDETAAVRHAAGFEVKPGAVTLGHDVYAFGYGAVLRAGSFAFGSQPVSGRDMHNLSFALLDGGVVAAPLFLSDIRPGSSPLIEVILAAGMAGIGPSVGLGSYDFSPFVPGQLQTVFLTNQASAWDGSAQALGTVSTQVTAVPEPAAAALLLPGLLVLALRRRAAWARRQRSPAAAPAAAQGSPHRQHGAAAPVATAALCLLSACGGGDDGTTGSAEASSTDLSAAARSTAAVVPMLLAEDGSVMPSIPDAEPAQPGPRTRSARYATRAQAAQLAAALDQKVLWVDAADLFARGDRLAAAAAVLLRETVQPDAAPEPGAQGDVPVFVTGDDAASAAAAADLLSAHGLRLVWWVTR